MTLVVVPHLKLFPCPLKKCDTTSFSILNIIHESMSATPTILPKPFISSTVTQLLPAGLIQALHFQHRHSTSLCSSHPSPSFPALSLYFSLHISSKPIIFSPLTLLLPAVLIQALHFQHCHSTSPCSSHTLNFCFIQRSWYNYVHHHTYTSSQ